MPVVTEMRDIARQVLHPAHLKNLGALRVAMSGWLICDAGMTGTEATVEETVFFAASSARLASYPVSKAHPIR